MKKRPHPSHEQGPKPAQPEPTFRPLEAQLKKLADEKKRQEADKQAEAKAARAKGAKRT